MERGSVKRGALVRRSDALTLNAPRSHAPTLHVLRMLEIMNANHKEIVPEGTGGYQQFMKTKLKLVQARMFCAVALGMSVGAWSVGASEGVERESVERGALVRGSDALTLYAPLSLHAPRLPETGDGLAVSPTAEGARLRCIFQRLEGQATREGLWLTSTVIPPSGTVNDRFRIVAAAVGRELGSVERESVERGALVRRSDALTLYAPLSPHAPRSHAPRLPDTGTVALDGQSVRFTRPGLTEE